MKKNHVQGKLPLGEREFSRFYYLGFREDSKELLAVAVRKKFKNRKPCTTLRDSRVMRLHSKEIEEQEKLDRIKDCPPASCTGWIGYTYSGLQAPYTSLFVDGSKRSQDTHYHYVISTFHIT